MCIDGSLAPLLGGLMGMDFIWNTLKGQRSSEYSFWPLAIRNRVEQNTRWACVLLNNGPDIGRNDVASANRYRSSAAFVRVIQALEEAICC